MRYLKILLLVIVTLLIVWLVDRFGPTQVGAEYTLIAPQDAVYEPMTVEDTPIVVDTQSENYQRAMRWAQHKEGDPRPADWDTNMTIVEFE